jgi:hypothetical protein
MQKPARFTEEDLHKAGYTVVGNEAVPLGDARPDPSWDEDRLALYAKGELANSQDAEEQAILQARKSAVHLFRAGHALALAREKCKGERHGGWKEFKDRHGLKDTTANDAIRLYENAKTEAALVGLGITEAKEKYVYPAKTNGSKDASPSPPARQRATNPGGQDRSGGRSNGQARLGDSEADTPGLASAPDEDHEQVPADATEEEGQALVGELEEIAQRLSEIAQDEIGKVAWSAAEWGRAKNAVLAVQRAVVVVKRRLNNEQPLA